MRLTGALMTLCALIDCGGGRQASLATPVLSYNGSNPFPAVIGESIALTPAVSGTIGHCTVNPPLPSGLSLELKAARERCAGEAEDLIRPPRSGRSRTAGSGQQRPKLTPTADVRFAPLFWPRDNHRELRVPSPQPTAATPGALGLARSARGSLGAALSVPPA